jgi:hypothetical protein
MPFPILSRVQAAGVPVGCPWVMDQVYPRVQFSLIHSHLLLARKEKKIKGQIESFPKVDVP